MRTYRLTRPANTLFVRKVLCLSKRLANYYNTTVNQIINLNSSLPKEVVIEGKEAHEPFLTISELDQDDRTIVFKMIDKMLTSTKFKTFFKENVASL